MKRFIIYLFAFTVLFASCNKDDDDETTASTTTTGESENNDLTITSDNFAIVGESYNYVIDTTDVDSLSLLTIDNVVDLTMLSADDFDTTKYRDPADFASHTDFPNSNLAMETDQYVVYMTKTTDKLEVVGVYFAIDTIELSIPFTDRLTLVEFPISLGDSVSDYGTGSTTITVPYNGFDIPVTVTIKMQSDYVINSQEQINTPVGTEVCLKEFRTLNTIMTTSLGSDYDQNDTTMTYNYYSNNKADTYVEISLDTDTNITEIRYLE